MIRMTVEQDNIKRLIRVLQNLEYKAPKRLADTSNRTAVHIRKVIKDETRKRYIVKAKDVNKSMKLKKGGSEKPSALIYISGEHLNLAKFKIKQGTRKTKKRKRVGFYLAHVEKESDFAALSTRPRPFLAKMGNGFSGMFVRKTDEPGSDIRGVAGPSIPQIIGSEDIMKKVIDGGEILQKRIEHEIDHIITYCK